MSSLRWCSNKGKGPDWSDGSEIDGLGCSTGSNGSGAVCIDMMEINKVTLVGYLSTETSAPNKYIQ